MIEHFAACINVAYEFGLLLVAIGRAGIVISVLHKGESKTARPSNLES